MATNNIISRASAQALMPEQALPLITGVLETSSVLKFGRRLPDMSRGQARLPVLSALATAGWITGDTGLKQTTDVSWADKYIYAEEIAAIVPIAQNVLDDAGYPIWEQVRPIMVAVIGAAIDAAVYRGVNAPASFPDDILTAAVAASNYLDLSTQLGLTPAWDLFDITLGDGGLFSMVEKDGFLPSASVGAVQMAGKFRGIRDSLGQPIFLQSMQQGGDYTLGGVPIAFPKNGALPGSDVLLIVGDFTQLVYSIRQDVTFSISTDGVITDNAGNIVYNLFQQDMVAMRVVMRLGWQVPNPLTMENSNSATRYPFAVLVP